MDRDSQRGTFLSRAVLASSGSKGRCEKQEDYQILLSAFELTADGKVKQKNKI